MIAKLGASYYAWQIHSSASAAEVGYETMNNPEPRPDPFAPSSYSAPPQQDAGTPVQSQVGQQPSV